MARVPQVTRTMITTKVRLLCVDVAERKTFETSVTLPRTYKDDDALMKAVRPVVENDSVKLVNVMDTEIVETLYGMSEQEFIEHAQVLPSRAKTED